MRRARGPATEGAKCRFELAAPVGQLIDLRCRRRGKRAAPDDAVRLELAEALREHVRACARKARADVGEALRPVAQLAEDQDGPAFAYQLERVGEPAEVVVCALLRRHPAYIIPFSPNTST